MLELLSPAGDLECLMSAVDYGCDAVYLGSTMFGMRAGAAKFDPETLRNGVAGLIANSTSYLDAVEIFFKERPLAEIMDGPCNNTFSPKLRK